MVFRRADKLNSDPKLDLEIKPDKTDEGEIELAHQGTEDHLSPSPHKKEVDPSDVHVNIGDGSSMYIVGEPTRVTNEI